MVFLCWFIWYIMCCVLSHMSTVRCPRMQWHFCCCLLVCSLACLLCVHFDFVIWLSHSPSGLSIINEKLFRTYLQLTESELTKVRFISRTKPGTTHTHTRIVHLVCVYIRWQKPNRTWLTNGMFFFLLFLLFMENKRQIWDGLLARIHYVLWLFVTGKKENKKKTKLLIGKCTMNAVRLP